MKIATKSAMALFAAGLLLAGCSRSSEDPPVPVENDTPAVEENMTAPEETPVMTNDAETVAPVRPTSTRRFSRYGCENNSARSRSASFHTAALPSNRGLSKFGVNSAGATIAVVDDMLMRPSAASTRSSAKRGCPGGLVNGAHAVEISFSGSAGE